nr:MAG TPA: hypothetical protein [Caudoviricetes sp.]
MVRGVHSTTPTPESVLQPRKGYCTLFLFAGGHSIP